MKRILFALSIIVISTQLTKAQTKEFSGTISDTKGNTLHHVFVGDIQNKYATFTDSLGNFSIAVRPDTKLEINMAGYKDTVISAGNGGSGVQLVLTPGTTDTKSQGALSAQMEIQSTGNGQVATMAEGGSIAPAHQKLETKGSQYLFTTFVRGYIIDAKDNLVYNANYQFDYNKITGDLLLARDGHTIETVNYDQVKGFTLFSPTDQRFDFVSAPAVDKSHYVQALADGKKYQILKLTKTKFVKADFVNTGIVQHGTDYDEYVDEPEYYVLDVPANQPMKLSLKKKSIKEDFAKEADKVNKYLSSNSGSIDDDYLGKLGEYMNQ